MQFSANYCTMLLSDVVIIEELILNLVIIEQGIVLCQIWSKLNNLQLVRYAEYFTKMEFAFYGLEVYTSEVDDHGIDFIVKDKKGRFCEIQVKAKTEKGYVFNTIRSLERT